ncbi:MAG: recombination protein NinB [Betaproteobacteria bacterium]|nr:recombination protein NinB [Betaproteobacteria bacterium]
MTEAHDVIEMTIPPDESAREIMAQAWQKAKASLDAGLFLVMKITPRKLTRSLAQNALLWALLHDVSRQVTWYGRKLTPEEWKDVTSAAWRKQEVMPGIDGGFVVLGVSTSRLSVAQMAELIELIQAFGIEHNVKFGAPTWMWRQASGVGDG